MRHGVITQFELILIVNTALNREGSQVAWCTSHIRVNACPSKMQPFAKWLKKHKALVTASDLFFESCDSLFDATPAMMWKNMSEIQCQQVCSLLVLLECCATTNPNSGSLWSIGDVRKGAIGYSWLDGLLRNPWSGVQPPQVLGYSGLRVAEPLVRGSNP